MFPFKKYIFVVIISLCVSLLASCSAQSSTSTIRATLFLLDGSASLASTVNFSTKEQQLRKRLTQAFINNEAIYFDFIRNNFSKQEILPLISMKTIVKVNDDISEYAKNKDVRSQTKKLVSDLWAQALADSSKSVDVCIKDTMLKLDTNSSSPWETRAVAQNLCISAEKAKVTFARIRIISSGQSLNNGFIGSDVEGAFEKGLRVLESTAKMLRNKDLQPVAVIPTIVISSDMMQRSSTGEKVIDVIRNMNDDEIADYIRKEKGEVQERDLNPDILVDGWASTKKNYSEKDRDTLEVYWTKWFESLGLEKPDFGFGALDWSVD